MPGAHTACKTFTICVTVMTELLSLLFIYKTLQQFADLLLLQKNHGIRLHLAEFQYCSVGDLRKAELKAEPCNEVFHWGEAEGTVGEFRG